jgi:GTPase SAR1 family protein/predicted regulator of Ras-like GTPase activity (Roadblock/LC7/MglB family)
MGFTTKEWMDRLLGQMISQIDGIKAIAVVLRNGLIVHSIIKDTNAEDDIIGAVTAKFDIFINRIKKDFGSANNFFSVLKQDLNKICFANAGPNSILTIITELNAEDERIKVYARFVGTKLAQFFNDEQVDPDIPKIIEILSKMRSGKLPEGKFPVKILLVGEPGSGKTSLIHSIQNKNGQSGYVPTMGIEISEFCFNLSEQCVLELKIWDMGLILRKTPGYLSRFYSGADFVLLCVDITRKRDFDLLDSRIKEIQTNITSPIPILIVATKTDSHNRAIAELQLEKKAEELQTEYFITSVVTQMNVFALFEYCGLKYIESKFGN